MIIRTLKATKYHISWFFMYIITIK